ncbi:hypothetical protein BOW53_04020 [Solemya pervernicosa gill symbiont]|uniref:Guanylate cyclase domain-containing protein n=2 Tax=Gammaproteobacteria incertae sedis TaxID=118884 RepID=A0A1T2L8J6_9GAMM|nr:adenylate/guanylate cyclase domain-containing protein [Candidatus Reidiella endopervernicosa]OOZ41423.1 hypothetical protein BOW53_04020 [Solemya pervernicosa gill symbiont]QKQ27540.1 adenylate/guanylate cyclase domain-containing protein [Candidatus Reidiella endopervernicosa]
MDLDVTARLKGTRTRYIVHEFFTNTFHYPLASIILELLLHDALSYLYEIDPYVIISAAVIQAMFYGSWLHRGLNRQFVGNLIAPAIYTLFEVSLEGMEFFESPHHIAYWGFAIAIGITQQVRDGTANEELHDAMIMLESVVRTCIFLALYMILEVLKDGYSSYGEFMASASHQFVVMVIPLLGMVFGFANINTERYHNVLMRTAQQLREYSEWFLGTDLLSKAVNNPEVLSLKRHERSMVFTDIRGFTRWSETRSPEEVVAVMNAYYEAAEPVWVKYQAIKVKLTADEIMLVFSSPEAAAEAAIAMLEAVRPLLEIHGLGVGTGIHTGPVVEGVMGGNARKSYDLLGDSVNTAKRLCDNAELNEILASTDMYYVLGSDYLFGNQREIEAKGKAEPVKVRPLFRGLISNDVV